MWFPTKEKVARELDRLLTRCEAIDQRIRVYEEQAKILGSIFGPAPEVTEWRVAQEEIYGNLMEASTGVRYGNVSYLEIAPSLKPVRKAIDHFDKVLDLTDAASAAGKAAAQAHFGK
ncbi:MAG: hypothetical protein QOJ94_1682 [Sphingomonadales bacterium]|jgi:hypothetical protein|nr:hypothetical protein [Sphingomonadales bacterium]